MASGQWLVAKERPAAPSSAADSRKRSRNGLGIFGRVSEGELPPAGGAKLRSDRLDRSGPSRPLQAHFISPNPFRIPYSILQPLDCLAPYLSSAYRALRHAVLPAVPRRSRIGLSRRLRASGLSSLEGLDLSGGEPYSFHERKPMIGAL